MEKQLKLYVAPKLQALGKIDSLTNAISCTGFANKPSGGADDTMPNGPIVGDPICL